MGAQRADYERRYPSVTPSQASVVALDFPELREKLQRQLQEVQDENEPAAIIRETQGQLASKVSKKDFGFTAGNVDSIQNLLDLNRVNLGN